MTDFFRVATYGEPVFVGPGAGPLWRHTCGYIVGAELLADTDEERRPWAHPCPHCRLGTWLPLFVHTGALCDQCDGNGWVPIGGKVLSAPMGFSTVTECTACDASGIAP